MGGRPSWLKGIARAGGVAFVVPLGLLLAVAVAASVGGGSFGGLGQLVAGPEVPRAGAGTPTSTRGPSDAGLPRLPRSTVAGRAARDSAAGAQARRPGRTLRAGDRSSGGSGPRPDGPGGPSSAVEVGSRAPSPTRPAPAFRPTPSPATPDTPGATTPSPNLVRRLGSAGQTAIRPLPVVGPPAADAVGTVVDLVAPPLL